MPGDLLQPGLSEDALVRPQEGLQDAAGAERGAGGRVGPDEAAAEQRYFHPSTTPRGM